MTDIRSEIEAAYTGSLRLNTVLKPETLYVAWMSACLLLVCGLVVGDEMGYCSYLTTL